MTGLFSKGEQQMLSIHRVPAFIMCVMLLAYSLSVSPVAGADCGAKGDWKDIYILPTNGDGGTNIKISLRADKTQVQPGDIVALTFESDGDCYLTIMDMGTSGRIVRLWPNQYSGGDNFVPANSPRSFPSPNDRFQFKIGGPGGVERIVAYATSEKGKILTEEEFQVLQNTPFKQFIGGAKDLAATFSRATESLGSGSRWGTSQVNLCIGSGQASFPSTDTSSPGTIYLVSVGAPTGQLQWCIRDAQRFADTIKSKLGVNESNVRLILGADATYQGFVSGLEWLAARTQPEDSAIIYFSGHGSSIPDQPPLDEEDGRDECFVLYPGGSRDYKTAIRDKTIMVDDDFNVRLKKIPARKKMIVADCCHSGTIHKAVERSDTDIVVKYWPLIDPDTGAEMERMGSKSVPTNYGNDNEALLAACLDNQSSYEVRDKKAGLFTHNLLEAINKGADNLDQAFQTAKDATQQESDGFVRQSGGKHTKQNPSLTDPHGYVKLFKFSK